MTLTDDARQRLDAHLDAVEQALAGAGNTREHRRAVVDDLEAQINEMLAARSPSPSLADVEAVLAQVDPPAAYDSSTAATTPPPIPAASPLPAVPIAATGPRFCRAAIWGLVCILVSFTPSLVILPLGYFAMAKPTAAPVVTSSVELAPPLVSPVMPAEAPPTLPTSPNKPATADKVAISPGSIRVDSGGDHVEVTPGTVAVQSDGRNTTGSAAPTQIGRSWKTIFGMVPCFVCLIGPFGILGTVLGWVAFFQIRNSQGALYGKPLALFDGLFYPVILLCLLAIA